MEKMVMVLINNYKFLFVSCLDYTRTKVGDYLTLWEKYITGFLLAVLRKWLKMTQNK